MALYYFVEWDWVPTPFGPGYPPCGPQKPPIDYGPEGPSIMEEGVGYKPETDGYKEQWE